jgi:hypothetical protein
MLGINEIRSVTPASKKLKLETFWQEIRYQELITHIMLCFLKGWQSNLAGKHKNSTVNSGKTLREATTWKTEKKIGGLHRERYRERCCEVWMCVEMVQNFFQRRAFLRTVLDDTSVNKSPDYEEKLQVASRSNALPLFYFCHAVQATPPTRTCGVFVSYKRVRSFLSSKTN